MNKKLLVPGGRVQIGITSLILIFTVLCLVIFAALSLSSAAADHKLAVKNAENLQAFYEADRKTELRLKEIDQFLAEAKTESEKGEAAFGDILSRQFQEEYDEKHHVLSFSVPISTEQSINIRLQLKQAHEILNDRENYTVQRWTVHNEKDYDIDDTMNVWDGGSGVDE